MEMSPERWEAIKSLFEAALDEAPSRRCLFLQQRCPDPTVRAEVERLLAEHDKAREFLSTPAIGNLAPKVEPETEDLLEGKLLAGRFLVVRFIAGGGMGEVYEAEDQELRERVAIKTIRAEVLAQRNAVARFRREVHLARKVTHPNVCRIFDMFRHKLEVSNAQKEIVFISMELLNGKTLAARLKKAGWMSEIEALPLVRQMASALAAAHGVGVVHRDFKPGNVVLVHTPVQETVRAVVTDFGLAVESQFSDDAVSLSTGKGILGTPAYMAPEQLEGRPATTASDIYAFGLVIYEMVTGARPFNGDTPASGALMRLSESPRPPRQFRPGLSIPWETAILRCLERDPASRFSSAEEIVAAISGQSSESNTGAMRRKVDVRGASTPVAEVGGEHRNGSADGQSWSRSRPRQLFAVALGVLLAATAFAVDQLWLRPKTTTSHATITRISRWNRPILGARLSPDGHSVAFTSRVNGTEQVFIMLTSGGDPLQLTNDMGDKSVDAFSHDGKQIYYTRTLGRNEVWAVPTLGGAARRVVAASCVVPSRDGVTLYYGKSYRSAIYRADQFGLNEQVVYDFGDTSPVIIPILQFPDSDDLLVVAGHREDPSLFRFFRVRLSTHQALDLGEVSAYPDFAWGEPGKTVLFRRTDPSTNGVTNIWKYDLKDRTLRQITFGAGTDSSPMPDPGGKGMYYVSGQFSGFLTAYDIRSKRSTDILFEEATQPIISPDGKHLMYITVPTGDRNELWVSDVAGENKVKIVTRKSLGTGAWASDNLHLFFFEIEANIGTKGYIVGADGNGLREVLHTRDTLWSAAWSPDQESLYVSASGKGPPAVWRWSLKGESPEELVDNCGAVSDVDPGGQYLLSVVQAGEKTGIYGVSISEKKCISLIPETVTFAASFAHDGESFAYAVQSESAITIYRQPWKNGIITGASQTASRIPFVFHLDFGGGNAYDFSRDLSTVVYVRSDYRQDLYLLSWK
jgi:serine/threonine protein kinase/Tol biopolymer transport system component